MGTDILTHLYYTRAALKLMPFILSLWPIISEAGVGSSVVETNASHQYSVVFYYHGTDGRTEAV